MSGGAIGMRDGRIVFVGALSEKPETLAREVHDCEGRWITPGLIDCHTHLVYGGNRAAEFEKRLNGTSYEEIAKAGGGILSTLKATRDASEADLFIASLARLQALMREGVCGIEIKSGYGLTLESERKCLRIAARLAAETGLQVQKTFLGAHALPPEYAGRADEYIAHLCEEMLPALHAEGLVDAVDGFCETIAFSPSQIERVFKAARGLGLPVKLHAEQLSNLGGAALAAQYKALSADHLEYIDEAGVARMAKAGTVAVLLPGAFYTLREKQLPPVDLFRKHSVPMALATDHNPGTSPAGSLLLMMNMACTLFRMTPEEALRGVTVNAARALGWEDCGVLREGGRADFALWDIGSPAELSYRFGANPCAGVVRRGI
jgi:imidazolonepropionase